MWFGDLVTMRWWNDLWLNESFAEYLAQRCCSEATAYPAWTEFGVVRKDWGSVADQSPSTHPVASNGARDAESALQDFDGISYAKGAAVLKQLHAYLGDEVFLAGLRSYFSDFAYGNATFDDLIAHWTASVARARTVTTAPSIFRHGRRAGSGRPEWTRSMCSSPRHRS